MDIIKLELNKVYKYAMLCEIFEEKKKTGKSKRLQVENWRRSYNIEDGEKATFIITEKYPEAKKKIDNRGKSEGSRNNYEGVYATYIDTILSDYFNKSSNRTIYNTSNQLAKIVGLINQNYSFVFSNKDNFFRYSFKELDGEVNKTCMWDFFGRTKSVIKGTIRSTLDRFARKKYIQYHETHMLVYNNSSICATELQNEIIGEIETEMLICISKTKQQLQFNDKWRNIYYAQVLKETKRRMTLDTMYIGYKIGVCQHSCRNFYF